MGLRYLGGAILHVWTIILVFQLWGGFWAFFSIFFPGFATIFVCFRGASEFGVGPFFLETTFGMAVILYVVAFLATFVVIGMAAAVDED